MLKRFYAKAGGIFHIPIDNVSTLETVARVITSGVCVIGPKSCAGALLAPFPYNHNYTVAHIVFWYFESPRQIEILKAVATECHEAGATHINPSSVWPANTIGRYYEKHGLSAAETQWLGEITCLLHKRD